MTGHVQIYGGIGTERNEIGFDNVKAQLDAEKASTDLAVHIVSPGGDVFEGEAIYNLLVNAGKPITTYVEGTCASIATLIAAAGDKIVMNRTGRFMIHNPKISGLNSQADARDLRHVANQLDKIKTLLIDVYDRKTTLGKPKLWELYDNETWYTADEAKQAGFVDEVVDAIKAVAKVDLKKYHMKNQTIWTKIQNLLNLAKLSNEMMETLSDDRVIVVQTEDEDWTGKPVFYEDGTPLPPGTYQLKSGKTFSVAEEGVIETVQAQAEPEQSQEQTTEKPAEAETPDPMKENESLKAQLAEALAANQALQAQVAQSQGETKQAKADTLKIQNRLSMIEKDFMELKTEASKTFGDTSEPKKGPVIKNVGKKDEQYDPMGEEFRKHLKNRNLIHDED